MFTGLTDTQLSGMGTASNFLDSRKKGQNTSRKAYRIWKKRSKFYGYDPLDSEWYE